MECPYHDGYAERRAEILENYPRGSRVVAALAPHRAGLVQQQGDSQLRRLARQGILVEHLAVIPAERVGVEPATHHKAGLPAAPPAVAKLLCETLLQLPRNGEQRPVNGIVLRDHVLADGGHAVYADAHALVDVAVGDALRGLVQLTEALVFKLLADGLLSHVVQQALYCLCRVIIA